MTSTRFFALPVFVLLLSMALLGFAPLQAEAQTRAKSAVLSLEDFFKGKTYAYGRFSAINGTTRGFRVDLTGRVSGARLTLREDFIYDDGERDTKTWVFTRTGPKT